MWLCTKLGFFSIVAKTPAEVHIRARAEKDLHNLRRLVYLRNDVTASRWKIHRTSPADYRWRIVIRPEELTVVLHALAMDLDYSNFKGVIASRPDQRDKLAIYSAFHHALEHWQNNGGQRLSFSSL